MKALYINFLKVLFTVFGLVSATDYALSQTITSWSYDPVTTSTYCSPHTQNYTIVFSSAVSATYLGLQTKDQNDIQVGSTISFTPSSGSSTSFSISVTYNDAGTKYLWVDVDAVYKGKSKPVVVSNGATINTGTMNDPSGLYSGDIAYMTLLNYTGTITGWQKRSPGGTWGPTPVASTTNNYSEEVSATTEYRAILQNDCGLTDYSDPGTATVYPALPVPTIEINGTAFCDNDAASIKSIVTFSSVVPSYNVELRLYDWNGSLVDSKDFENATFANEYTAQFGNLATLGHGYGNYYVKLYYAGYDKTTSSQIAYSRVANPVISNPISISFPACPTCTTSISACNTEYFDVNASWAETGSVGLKWYQGNTHLTNLDNISSITIHPDQYTPDGNGNIAFKVEGEKLNSCGDRTTIFQPFTVSYSNKAVSTSIAPTPFFCKDIGGSLTGSAYAPGATSVSYNWKIDNGDYTTENSTSYSIAGLSAGQHTATLRATATFSGTCLASIIQYSNPHTFTVYDVINAGTVPATYGPVCEGTSVTFDATPATGGGSLTYSWLHSIGGQEQPSLGSQEDLTIPATNIAVWRRVTDNTCNIVKNTTLSTLTAYPTSQGGTASTTTPKLCGNSLNSSVVGNLTLSGSTGTVTWKQEYSDNGGTSWTGLSNASVSGSEVTISTYSSGLRKFRVFAEVKSGTCAAAYSSYAYFDVYPYFNPGTVSTTSYSVCRGGSLSITPGTSSGGNSSSEQHTYQWRRFNTSINDWENYPGQTGATFSVTNLQSAWLLKRQAYDSQCGYASTDEITISLDEPPTIGTLSLDLSELCGSGEVDLSLSAASADNIKWYVSSQVGTGGWSGWGSSIASGTALTVDNYGISNPNTQTMKFRFKAVAERGVCSNAETTVGTSQEVTVYPEVLPGTIVGFGDEAYGMATGHLAVQNYQSNVVRWESSTDQVNWTAATQDPQDQSYEFSFNNLNQTTWFRAFVSGTGCPEIETAPAVVTVYQVPLITITGSPFIPPGGATTIEVNDDYYSYQWYKNGVLMSGETAINVSLNEPDSYTIKVKATETSPEGESDPILIKSLYGIGQNVIGKTTFRVEGVEEQGNIYGMPLESYVQSLSYLDGLGRPYQTIGLGTSPQQTDMIQSYKIEPHTNISTGYLPYASDQRLGAVRTTAINNQGSYTTSEQYAFYSDTQNNVATSTTAYAQTESEASPLGRVKRQGAPDTDWQLNTSHTVNYAYRTNTAADGVLQWTEAGPGSAYAANILSVNEVTDENGNKVLTFTDGRGRTVLKKVQLDETIGGQSVAYLETYYVYDRWSNLVYQVPPKAVALLAQSATWDQAFKDEWVFQYVYDDKFRLIEKKTPDADWTYVAYDPLNRPVLVQDANLRSANKWYFTKWDEKGRAVMSGVYQNNTQTSRSAIQSLLDGLGYISGSQKWYEKKQGSTTHGYSNQAFPTTGAELLTVMYYDNHDLDANGSADRSYQAQGMTNEASPWPYLENQATASKKKLIGTSTETWLYEYYFYDKRGRATQVQSTNHLYTSAPDNITTMVYAFDGLLERQKTVHKAGATAITITNRYEYDHVGRLRKVYQKNNSDAEQLVAAYEYNEIGQLLRKKLHAVNLGAGGGSLKRNGKMYAHEIESDNYTGESEYVASSKITLKPGFSFKAESGKTFRAYLDDAQLTQLSETVAMQAVDYAYNTRGWLKTINDPNSLEEADPDIDQDDFFGMELLYNTTESGLNTNAYFNGNIAAVKWNTAGEHAGSAGPKGFAFTYDKSDKLGQASFKHDSANWISPMTNGLNETMTYDHNGNIASLNRNEIDQWTGNASQVDQLTYDYSSGNQLTEVTDGSGTTGFVDAADATNEMGYDTNGNLIKDLNKDITGITYNILNKPETITFGDGRLVKYTYDATGAKVKMAFYSDATTLEKIIDYVGGFEYHDNTLRYFASPEGRVVNKGGDLVYEYALADHQGNTRAVFTSEPDEVHTLVTLEPANIAVDTAALVNYNDITNIQNGALYNHTPNGSWSNWVNGSQNKIIGMAQVMKVYPGDEAQIEVFAKYTQPTNNDSEVSTFLASAALTNFTNFGFNGTETSLATSSFNTPDLFGNGPWVGDGTIDENIPKGRLNFILFDRDFIPVDWGFKQISIAALETGSGGQHERLSLEVPDIPEAGYLYVYVSNENEKLVDIYFDDLKVTHIQNPLMQATDYYPFGAVASTSWTRETATPNPYLYNAGSELNEKTGWYETFYRGYDPYLGRFNGVDRMADKFGSWNPYQYGYNDPVYWNDPKGDCPPCVYRYDDTYQADPHASPSETRERQIRYASMASFLNIYGGSYNWTGLSDAEVYGGGISTFGDNYTPGEYYGSGRLGQEYDVYVTETDWYVNGVYDGTDRQYRIEKSNRSLPSSENAMTLVFGVGVSTEGLAIALSEAAAVGAAAVAGWSIGDLIGTNIETISETTGEWLVSLGVPEELLYHPAVLNSKGGRKNIWPDQYGTPPNVGTIDWSKSDSELANELSDEYGDNERGPTSPNNVLKKWFRDKRPK